MPDDVAAEPTGEPDEQQLRALLDGLLSAWDAERAADREFRSRVHPARVTTIYALATHAHRLGGAVANLYDAGLHVESMPIIRSAYETALHAAWLQQVDDALPAYLNRNHSMQRALRDTAQRAGWGAFLAPDTQIPADQVDPFVVSPQSREGAKRVQDLCADLSVGGQAYSLYRALSWFTHPTALVCDLYAHLPDDRDVPMLLRSPNLEPDFMAPWLHVMCSSLVWSARSLNMIDDSRKESGTRERLRRAARELRIVERISVTPDAAFRGQRAERLRKRSDPD